MEANEDLADGTHRGVVDRVGEAVAVVLVGDDERETHVDVGDLPDGVGSGAWVHLEVIDGVVVVTARDEQGEQAARRRAEQQLERIRRKQGGGRFGR